MDFQFILFQSHSGLRWLVVLLTAVAFVWLLYRWSTAKPYNEATRRVMLAWSSLVGVQWLLGILLIVIMGTYPPYQIEHAVTMTLALIAAHLYLPFKRRNDRTRYLVGMAIIVSTAVLVYIGVARLPQGWEMGAVTAGLQILT